jgi:catechol 2,3-dioxygenase-like lactoylglutathione lyase family enzyme
MIRHLAGLADIVEDVNEALKFYRDTLGLEVKEQDGDDYAVLIVPGVLHFGVWSRAHAAQCMFGDRAAVDRVPLGCTLEFEVDSVDETAAHLKDSDWPVPQGPQTEPWDQKTCRVLSPGGGVLGFAETPWGRKLVKHAEVEAGDG